MESERPLILIVDDNPTNIDVLVNLLKADHRLGIAKNGANALSYAAAHHPDLILLDIMMPGMDGFEVCQKLKDQAQTADIPVIFITAVSDQASKAKGFGAGGVDYVTKPFHGQEVRARVETHVHLKKMQASLKAHNILLEEAVAQKTADLKELLTATIHAMAAMVEVRDPYTAGHQKRVAFLAYKIAEKLGLSADRIQAVCVAGMLHDIGKVRIPVSILNRSGKLLAAEYEMIRIHPRIGYDLLKDIPFPWPVAQIVLEHHERLDGSGYPQMLRADDILTEAKILAVADVAEAKSSFRPYRPALGIAAAMDDILRHCAIRYDADAVTACRKLFLEEDFTFDKADMAEVLRHFSGWQLCR
jgi:putative two-component system response regulator